MARATTSRTCLWPLSPVRAARQSAMNWSTSNMASASRAGEIADGNLADLASDGHTVPIRRPEMDAAPDARVLDLFGEGGKLGVAARDAERTWSSDADLDLVATEQG